MAETKCQKIHLMVNVLTNRRDNEVLKPLYDLLNYPFYSTGDIQSQEATFEEQKI